MLRAAELLVMTTGGVWLEPRGGTSLDEREHSHCFFLWAQCGLDEVEVVVKG
jgi:hypothetical protein